MFLKKMIPAMFLSFMFLSGYAQSKKYIATDGYVEFLSKAPLHQFKGKSKVLHGLIDLNKNLVDFYVDLNTLKTGIAKRDSDMRNSYLDTEDHPFAEFTGALDAVEMLNPVPGKPKKVTATGTFSLHGVKRKITVEGTLTATEDGLNLKATWPILLEDYNIERPGFLFYELADEQIISIDIELHPSN